MSDAMNRLTKVSNYEIVNFLISMPRLIDHKECDRRRRTSIINL